LNGNWLKLDTAVGVGHNADGSHKSGVIDKAQLATSVADGSTIEKDVSVGLKVKDGGITKTQLATTVADASTIEKDASVGLRIKDGGVTKAKLATAAADATTIELDSGVGLRVKDGGITLAKLSGENPARQHVYMVTDESSTIKNNGLTMNTTNGIPFPVSGHVVRFGHCNQSTGVVTWATGSFSADPNGLQWSNTTKLQVDYSSTKYRVLANGSPGGSNLEITVSRADGFLVIWVEVD
jgi:hypothetical protein